MVPRRTKTRKNNKGKAPAKKAGAPIKSTRKRAAKGMGSYPKQYLSLLNDPCAGPLVSPPYAGTDGGYLIRTTDQVPITGTGTGMTVGNTYVGSAFFQYSPGNYGWNGTTNSAAIGGAFAPGGSDPVTLAYATNAAGWSSTNALVNFIASSSVKRARPVAACVKWIPTGPYNTRQGLVASSYVPATVNNSGDSVSYGNLQAAQQHYASNGTEPHEVKWLPTAADETYFTTNTSATTPGCGSIQFMLRNVDGVASSTTALALNGFFEVTTVWEWLPTETQGTTMTPRVPMPYTTQGLLSSITDLGEFLYGHSYSGSFGQAMRSVAGYSKAAARLLTGGVQYTATRAAPLLLGM